MRFLDSDLLGYIVEHGLGPGDRLTLDELSDKLKISTGKLREQLEVARAMGFVEVKPRTGITVAEFSFFPAVRYSLLYALARDHKLFDAFGELRNHIEFAFFREAVGLLTDEDCQHLKDLVERAWAKLEGHPARIPHPEHRDLHLTIYRRLDNLFVKGLLEAYWDAYEAEGLSVFTDYDYLHVVWTYHEGIVNAIVDGDVDEAYRLLVLHTQLLQKRPKARIARARNGLNGHTTDKPDKESKGVERQRATPR
jgi:DNA-binding FadR family transcriptional regulator